MYEEIIREIKSIREYYGIGFRALAKASNTSPSYIKRLEEGVYKNPSYSKLAALACAIEGLIKNKEEQWEETKYPNLEELLDWSEKHKPQVTACATVKEGLNISVDSICVYNPEEDLEKWRVAAEDHIGRVSRMDMDITQKVEFLKSITILLHNVVGKRRELITLSKLISLYSSLNPSQKDVMAEMVKYIYQHNESGANQQ
jgi:transcriptional regulator with XRE-family HTH domain